MREPRRARREPRAALKADRVTSPIRGFLPGRDGEVGVADVLLGNATDTEGVQTVYAVDLDGDGDQDLLGTPSSATVIFFNGH